MKRLHDKVNVIPLIAKADTLTPEECQLFKKQVCVFIICVCTNTCVWQLLMSFLPSTQIMKEIQEHKIRIYEFPDTEDDEDSKLIRKIKVVSNERERPIRSLASVHTSPYLPFCFAPVSYLIGCRYCTLMNCHSPCVAGADASGSGWQQCGDRSKWQEGQRSSVPLGRGRR